MNERRNFDEQTILKKLLKYCQEVVTKQEDSNFNVMESSILYGQDFEDLGLQRSTEDEWFSVDESSRLKSASGPRGVTNQQQLFYDLFNLLRRSKLDGGELVCGIGIARKLIVDDANQLRRVWHPIILVPLDIDESGGHMRISPSSIHSPALWSMSPLCSNHEENQHKARELEDKFQKHSNSQN